MGLEADQVLHRARHAGQWSLSRVLGLCAGKLRRYQPVGVEARVQLLDPLQVHLDELTRRDLAAFDGDGLL